MDEEGGIPCKVVILGDSGVGKTSICQRWVNGTFDSSIKPTIGSNYQKKTLNIANHRLDICLWDTAGQEVYRSIAPLYARSASSIIIATSVDDKNSFDDIQDWLSLVTDSTSETPPMVLAINKADLQVNDFISDIINQFKNIFTSIIICSARTGEGIDNLFNTAAFNSYKFITKAFNNEDSTSITAKHKSTKQNAGCC